MDSKTTTTNATGDFVLLINGVRVPMRPYPKEKPDKEDKYAVWVGDIKTGFWTADVWFCNSWTNEEGGVTWFAAITPPKGAQ